MKNPIHNLDDYADFITKQLRTLRHFERCLFAVWCADRLLKSHTDLLADSLSMPDLRTLRRIVKELWQTLLSGVIPNKDQVNALDMDFLKTDTGWTSVTGDIQPVATIVQQSVGMCILCCRRNDVRLAQTVAQSAIECLDFELEEGAPNHLPDTVFERPEIRAELNVQMRMVKHLQGEYDLTPTLVDSLCLN